MGAYAKAIREIVDRLDYHRQAGQILAGVYHHEKPETKIEGLKDFPYVMTMIPSLTEASIGSSMGAGLKTIADGVLKVPVIIAVKREQHHALALLYELAEKVMDAVETRRDGTGVVDLNLATLGRITSMAVGNNFALDLSLNAGITITVESKNFYRGSRRTT